MAKQETGAPGVEAEEALLLGDALAEGGAKAGCGVGAASASRGRRLHGHVIALVGVCAGVALLALAAHFSAREASTEMSLASTVELAKVESKEKGTSDSKCSKSKGDNCHDTQCCEGPGMQCYEQEADYAQCRPACTPGPDPTHWDEKKWSCKELGPRTEGEDICVAAWQQCTASHCCTEVGFQCYEKNKTYATCKSECVAGGPDLSDADSKPWTCKELGARTPGQQPWVEDVCSDGLDNCVDTSCCKTPSQQCFLQNDYYGNCMTACVGVGDGDPWSCQPSGSMTPAPTIKAAQMSPWIMKECTQPYEGCKDSRCCIGMNVQCYAKNDDWATCMETCKPGKNPFDKNETWSCKELGPRSYGLAIKGFPSMYCFALMRPDSYENDLMKAQLEQSTGIFDCDEYAILTADQEYTLGDGPDGPVVSIQFQGAEVVQSQDNTAGNTELFVNAWEALVAANTWKNHAWIVKADPDAVVIPMRLRWHLAAHTGEHVFILNCNKFPGPNYPMVYGALEVFANSAIHAWADRHGDCFAPNTYGEDYYITRCMDHLGVGRLLDEKVLGDNLCMGSDCADGWTAAFHPYKDAESWEKCYKTAIAMNPQ